MWAEKGSDERRLREAQSETFLIKNGAVKREAFYTSPSPTISQGSKIIMRIGIWNKTQMLFRYRRGVSEALKWGDVKLAKLLNFQSFRGFRADKLVNRKIIHFDSEKIERYAKWDKRGNEFGTFFPSRSFPREPGVSEVWSNHGSALLSSTHPTDINGRKWFSRFSILRRYVVRFSILRFRKYFCRFTSSPNGSFFRISSPCLTQIRSRNKSMLL